MGFFFKKKKEVAKLPKEELEVPPAPPTTEELPSPEEVATIKAVKEAVEKPVKQKLVPSVVEQMEERAVEETKELVEEREDLRLQKPIFISLESFKDIIDEISLTSNILKENEDILTRINEFKEDEDKQFNKWESQLKDMQKKLIYVDKALFGMK
ncbi:hypothetical protein KY342_00230 [Candidatus Woesearchaeota archaeon]|nr:hypothetical protein [Candidatus Woesearchaeota archaeon]